MKIKTKSIRSLSKILKVTAGIKNIRLAVNLDGLTTDLVEHLGFNTPPTVGDYLMPSSIGKFTNFNANGREIVRKDLPKESESIMYYGTTRDWHGGLHSSTKTRTIKKYPRDYVSAPSETLQIVEIENKYYIASSELDVENDNESRIIHVCNLMIECFSEFEIFDTKTKKIIGPTLKRLQWDILPQGQYPWQTSRPIIEAATKHLEQKDREVIEHRMKIISRRNPDFLATGRGGFSGYFVYGFKSKDKYVLESIHLDNATYVFESNWEDLSQLTKNEIINSNVTHQRIIHNRSWATSIGHAIEAKKI